MKYLFTATYKDGTTYVQNPEDVSVKEPDKRSCFFDVDKDQLESFKLEGEGNVYEVNLIDGHFEVNGLSFDMHEEPLEEYKIIYFRRHTHTFQGEVELAHDTIYRLGWQSGSTQRVMQIK